MLLQPVIQAFALQNYTICIGMGLKNGQFYKYGPYIINKNHVFYAPGLTFW
jgi:hypothetical protein